jgi:hypothetical protein
MPEIPQYDHDCTACRFLGRFHLNASGYTERDYDLYVCPKIGVFGDELVARHSDEGSEYLSCSTHWYVEYGNHPALVEAMRRHQAITTNQGA